MTPTKLLTGQIAVVFAVAFCGIWFATQWAASRLAFQSELGPASFHLLGRPILALGALYVVVSR